MKLSLLLVLLIIKQPIQAGETELSNPIMFVTQFPISSDFGTIGSTFANHRADIAAVGRGGDLYIRYTNGDLRNLTREAGFGQVGLQTGNGIAVRDPSIHWSGEKALFSMVVGAPERFGSNEYYWQLYEITGFGVGETVSITKIQNQPTDYNNITPIYGSDDAIIFTSDMPRSKNRHNYPQYDEYESTPTNTGLWRLKEGRVSLIQHSPSGSFSPLVDSYGRLVFTRWDHLQRDQQASPININGAFNYSSESPNAQLLNEITEVFPEPRPIEFDLLNGTNLVGHRSNHFFPWQINQDGTEEETLNHVGRHELHSFFARSINDDSNVVDFIIGQNRPNQNAILNTLHLNEDPNNPGRFLAIDAPEFQTHSGGQLISFDLPLGADPSLVTVSYMSHESTRYVVADGTTASPEHVGFFREARTLTDGTIIASHTSETRKAGNEGTLTNPDPRYDFTIKTLTQNQSGNWVPDSRITNLNTVNISYYNPDELVDYTGPLWELMPVEVVAREVPTYTSEILQPPELQVFAEENVDVQLFKEFLKNYRLALAVMRDVTTRDELDLQQPYNLKVASSDHQTIANSGQLYEISHMQFFQGDQIRGYGGIDSPLSGQRVLAQFQHDLAADKYNLPFSSNPPGSTEIFSDGSVAFLVPANRAMSWQTLAPDGEAVVRERYWVNFQPGEIRACGGCHGVNQVDQAGQLPSTQKPEALRALLAHWKNTFTDLIKKHDFEVVEQ